ncbi:MAG: YjbQ family protein [Gallionella sp.]
MSCHLKSRLPGNRLDIPVAEGQPGPGSRQGICLCEHRCRGCSRSIMATVLGE